MTVTLGGIQLSDYLLLRGLLTGMPAAVNILYTMAGGVVAQTAPSAVGGPLTLEATEKTPVYTKAQIESIMELQRAGLPVLLDYKGNQYTVMIIKSNFPPLIDANNPPDDARYYGQLNLVRV